MERNGLEGLPEPLYEDYIPLTHDERDPHLDLYEEHPYETHPYPVAVMNYIAVMQDGNASSEDKRAARAAMDLAAQNILNGEDPVPLERRLAVVELSPIYSASE